MSEAATQPEAVSQGHATLSARLAVWSLRYHRLRTALLYRPIFGAIGRSSRIIRPAMLINTEFARLGRGVLIRHGARIECVREPGHAEPELRIGDDTNIEQNVHIVCRTRITIGAQVSIAGNCAIVDLDHPYRDVEDQRKFGERIDPRDAPVTIEDRCMIGMFCLVLPGSHIGRNSVIGAGSIVTGRIPEYSVALGRPARVVKRYDRTTRTWIAADQ